LDDPFFHRIYSRRIPGDDVQAEGERDRKEHKRRGVGI
jgi:hypothetical protein